MERVIFNQQNYIKEDESYHIDSLAIKKNKHRKKLYIFCTKHLGLCQSTNTNKVKFTTENYI